MDPWFFPERGGEADKRGCPPDQPGFFADVESRGNPWILVADASSHGRVAALLMEAFAPPDTLVRIESRPEFGNHTLLAGSDLQAPIGLEEAAEWVEETRERFQIEPAPGDGSMAGLDDESSHPGKPGKFTKGTASLKAGALQEIEDDIPSQAGPSFPLRTTVPDP
jgi:hypothetical protein